MIQDCMSIFVRTACYLGYIYGADSFCKKYLEISRTKETLFVILFFCGGIYLNLWNVYWSVPYILPASCMHILLLSLVVLLFRGGMEKKILAASVLITITTLAVNFLESFLSCLMLLWLHVGKHIEHPFLGEWEMDLIAGISFVIVTAVILWMPKMFQSVFYCRTEQWYIILAVPLLAVTAVMDVANWGASNGISVKSGGSMGIYYDQIFSHAEICVLAVLAMCATGFYIFGMNRIYLEQRKSSQYHFQIKAYKMLEEQYSQSERLRHDLKNHIIALSGLLENREWEKMSSYLKNMEGSAALENFEEVTGNKVVDVLLYQKRQMAEKNNILWECDVQIPEKCNINEFDLCVLFGNILDNAVEACERIQGSRTGCRSKFIHIQAGMVKKCFFLEVKNITGGVCNNAAGHTRKENPKEHGIGLLNVRDVVNRHNGTMHIEVQDAVFIISVLIPLE